MEETRRMTRRATERTPRMASRKATRQLQRVYDYLGRRSGTITTEQPNIWWNLALEKEDLTDGVSEIRIGVYRKVGNEVLYDPIFYLRAYMDGDRITAVEPRCYISEMGFVDIVIDANDRVISSHGEKDAYGLRKRFSSFMNNMTEVGPYLVSGKTEEDAQ